MRIFILATLLLAAGTARAQDGERIEIEMSNFKYSPATITLAHDKPYVLHFVNHSGGGHDFVAENFFTAANVAPADRVYVKTGGIRLNGGEGLDIHIVAPAPGRYKAHCSHFMHSTFGMTGTIVVN
ncbi:cupredoxin domain-containing protein [Sphingomonas japonica]|uniref:Plastocyanin n=1 Tax=Sphingomonas japonica TaxID=511662 RepID=A0ABX0U569_9SPHN|nr:cupredoxin domain-containing protein [Sphingomonas japonica]NIJ24457.1 plastocyanin [Sphingomonas japonica]